MKTDFKLQVEEVTGAWLLTIDKSKHPQAFPTNDEGDKKLMDAILKQLVLHRKFRISNYNDI